MSIPSSPGAVPTRDYTVQTYFPNNDQKFEVPQGSTLSGQWFQNLTFRNEFRAPSPLNNSSSALDCAIEASVTSRLIYELPTSSTGSAPHNTSDIPVKYVASFVQYIPDLANQYLQHYETSILTNARRATLTATTASSPQLIRFLAQHSELDQELFLGKDEAYYNSFLENMLKVSGLLAEVVDNSVCQGLRGWQIMKESQAFNVKMDLVVQNKGRGRVSLQVKQLKAGEKVLQAIEELSPVEGENVELGDGSETAQAALRKMAIHMEERKCEIGIITDLGSAMVFKLHKSEGATRSILLRSDRFYFYSQTVSLIRLVASLILTPDDTELIIDGVRDIPAGGSPGFTRSGASYQSPPKNPIATTPARRCQRVAPFTPCQSAGRKAAFEEEFGLGGVRVVGEGVTEDGRHSFVEIETGEGPLILYGEEKKWLEGRNLIPTAGKFKSENLLEAQHLTLINDFAVFTPTNLRQLTRMQLSHGQLTPPTTPPQPTPPLLVLALSSTIFQNDNSTVYATTVEDLKLVVKKLSKDQKELANQEAMMNTFGFRNLSADFVPKLFGFFTDEEGDFYLVFEYAGKASKFSELSFSERSNLYSNLKTLHVGGVLHGDFGEWNIVVGSGETDRRTVKIIDFGFSTMHKCKGEECWELKEARFMLGISQDM